MTITFSQNRQPAPAEKKAILVGVELPRATSMSVSFEELEGLATTANYHPVGRLS
jgi:hypothetical protein